MGLTACIGPKPEIRGVNARPKPGPVSAYEVAVTVENKGSGDGEVELVARLTEKDSGLSFQESVKFELKAHETTSKMVTIRVPDETRAPASQFQVEAEVEYPVE